MIKIYRLVNSVNYINYHFYKNIFIKIYKYIYI